MSDRAQAALWEAWRPLAEKSLGGLALETLSTTTADGAVLLPLYAPATPAHLGRPGHGPWQRIARVDAPGSAQQACDDLAGGAEGLALVFAGAPLAHGRGLEVATLDDLDAALDGVMLDGIALRIEAGARSIAAFALTAALIARRGERPVALHAGIDTLGAFASSGTMASWRLPRRSVADGVRGFIDLGVSGTALVGDGRIVAEAGAAPATELAFALHSVAAMLRALDEEGLDPSTTLPLTAIALSATGDQFATVAKFRAARRLHRLMADACGVATPLSLHATTAHRMLVFSDPETNLLRLTLAAFAAGVGGADSVDVLPFDADGSPFARRMARNIGALLIEEAHLGRLDDPGAGAGAVEAYTDTIAETAWTLFQAIEGDREFVASGRIADRVAADARRAQEAVAAGQRAIVGVTVHAPELPTPVAAAAPVVAPSQRRCTPSSPAFRDLVAAAHAGATLADLAGEPGDETPLTCPPIRPGRAAAPFGG